MYVKTAISALVLTLASLSAQAQAFSLNHYTVQNTYGLDLSVGPVSGLEGSAITYAQDRGSLFYIGDEGQGVIEISRTGAALGAMAFTGWGAYSTGVNGRNPGNDSEGLTYLGGGVLAVAEERLQNIYKFSYTAGGSVNLGAMPFASVGPTIGNVGIEGLSYDARNGNFITAKQDNPATLSIFNSLPFSTAAGPDAVATATFSGTNSLFGLTQLSDVQALSILGSDNLLVLSTGTGNGDSRELIEITRSGTVVSRLDLSHIAPRNAIEGVTIDERGTIYLLAEQDQLSGAAAGAKSQLIVLAAPVPEPETYALLLAGLGLMGTVARRKRAA
ncbi:MAG: SdiA-regulated domain-containing protein [Rhodoferax sp.]|nr:SdiA-regulated domain-containing protein [Rhodoferax sp.]MDZ7890908.1 SdiA-regulated domain-containing protein [Rhodoferax sp.]